MKIRVEQIGPCTLYLGDCLEILPTLEAGSVDAVVTDPPYLTGNSSVPIRGRGVAIRRASTKSVGMPWGYDLAWLSICKNLDVDHYVVFANYKMLAGVCDLIPPSTVFVWRKSNAPRMCRPVPRLDCEFIVWSRSTHATCERMGEFTSMVMDVPMPQAGCFAVERVLDAGTGKAAHACQKPLAVIQPFVDRLNSRTVLDPFMGSGTTGVACVNLDRNFIGIEIEPKYFDISCKRIERAWLDRKSQLPFDDEPEPQAKQLELLEA